MRYLITGGRGFIGSWVSKTLQEAGHEVLVLSNLSHPSKLSDGREYIYGDVRYEYDVDKAVRIVDCVIHLAARINVDRSRESARPFFDTNILGTFNVLEACRKYGKKMIHASTSEALGTRQEKYCPSIGVFQYDGGMAEDHPYSPDNPYGATKAAADMLCLGWYKSYDVDVTLLRSFNVAGIGQAYDREGGFIPKVIQCLLNNENPKIFGHGDQTRDYVWVGDVSKAYLLLSQHNCAGQVYHVGTGREVRIAYVAETLIRVSGKNLVIENVGARPKEIKRLKCDASKIKALGWEPTKTIEEVLEDMYDFAMQDKIGVGELEGALKKVREGRSDGMA